MLRKGVGSGSGSPEGMGGGGLKLWFQGDTFTTWRRFFGEEHLMQVRVFMKFGVN